MSPYKIGVTGANGYLGSQLVKSLRAKGYLVYALSRKEPQNKETEIFYKLGQEVDPAQISRLDTIIHCAYDFTIKEPLENHRVNVEGSLSLLRQASMYHIRFIFISSMSAFSGCKSQYGKNKLEVEHEVLIQKGAVIRPGLIYGEGDGGMFGSLHALVAKWSLIPVVGSGQQILFPCHVNDLVGLLERQIQAEVPHPEPILAVSEQALSLKQLLQGMAAKKNKKIAFLPIPWQLIWILLRVLEGLGVRMRMNSDSLVGLVCQDPKPDLRSTRDLNLHFRSFFL